MLIAYSDFSLPVAYTTTVIVKYLQNAAGVEHTVLQLGLKEPDDHILLPKTSQFKI